MLGPTNLHGVGEEAALVDELDEGQPGVLLQRVLPLLRAQQHHELHDRVARLEGRDGLALHEQVLAIVNYN